MITVVAIVAVCVAFDAAGRKDWPVALGLFALGGALLVAARVVP